MTDGSVAALTPPRTVTRVASACLGAVGPRGDGQLGSPNPYAFAHQRLWMNYSPRNGFE